MSSSSTDLQDSDIEVFLRSLPECDVAREEVAFDGVVRSLDSVLESMPLVQLCSSRVGDSAELLSEMCWQPTLTARFELLGEIGQGGMGTVFWCRDNRLGCELAIKVLRDEYCNKPGAVERFVEEARIAGQLQHPGLVPVHELGQFNDGRLYITMKLVQGQTLAALLAARKEPSEDRARFLGIFEQVCQTLAYVHARGVIHRDLKPANIMVGSFGEVQVMDWGLAKVLIQPDDNECLKSDETPDAGCEADAHEESATGSLNRSTNRGTVMGTPAYMSPEQAQGEMQRVNEASDVFGLGAILCEILTGQPPYVGKDIRRQAKNAELVDAFSRLDECGIDGRLLVIAKRCLAPEPLDRPRQAGELAAELKAYLESVADRLRRTELENVEIRARARHERKMRWMTSALAAMVLLVGLVGTAGWTRVQDERATRTKILQTYQERLERSARLGWWTEATHNFSEALRLAPEDQFFAFAFAPLLIQVGDLEGYRQHCQKLLTNWKDTDNIFFADQTAKACLLSAEAVIDPRKLSRLVQTALSAGPTHSEYKFFLLLRGFHAYRGGEFAEALAACQESRRYNQGPAENLQLTATDHAVEALAHHRLGHVDEARQSLAAAKRFVDERFESLVEGDLGEDWPNWLIAQLICSEAEALVEGKSEPRDEAEINTSAGIKRYPQELIIARISQRNIDRGHGSARHGAWAEAAHNFSEALALVPEDERSAFLLAPLLVQIGELDGYRQHCQALLAQWKNTNNVFFADQIAKACLLTPEAVSSPQELTRLVETALSAGPEHTEYKFFLLLKGLYDYRNGEFAEAVDACQACRRRNTKPAENLPLTAATHAIEAMAQHQFSHLDLSRQNLAMAQRIVDPQFAKLARGGDLGDDWHDWLIAQLLAREAESRLSDQRER